MYFLSKMREKDDREEIELKDILIEDSEDKNDDDSNLLLRSNIIKEIIDEESDFIKKDIQLLKEMGYNEKIINKVYIFFRPENIERAIDLLTPVEGYYHHNFIENNKNKNICYICNEQKKYHDNISYETPTPTDDDNLINNNISNNNNINSNKNIYSCIVCFEKIDEEEKNYNYIPCGHICCTHCWSNYLKILISESKIENIKCVDYSCKQKIDEEFILKHIKNDFELIRKYDKFKLRAEIIRDPNKKECPYPECDSYLLKSRNNKFVKCKNGHKFCYECLRPWHENNSCEEIMEKEFMNWKKNKVIKKCPRCKIYTEKNEGCNHMTCTNCHYQWCWLCEKEYVYGHYRQGRCNGHQFTVANSINELPERNNIEYRERREPSFCQFCYEFCQCICRFCSCNCLNCIIFFWTLVFIAFFILFFII